MEIIQTVLAPAAVGPYSQAVRAGEFLFISGQIGLDPATGTMVPGGLEEQTRQALKNLQQILTAAGAFRVIKTTCFLTDMKDFNWFNEIYAEVFSPPCPARSCVAATELPKGALCEIEAIAQAE